MRSIRAPTSHSHSARTQGLLWSLSSFWVARSARFFLLAAAVIFDLSIISQHFRRSCPAPCCELWKISNISSRDLRNFPFFFLLLAPVCLLPFSFYFFLFPDPLLFLLAFKCLANKQANILHFHFIAFGLEGETSGCLWQLLGFISCFSSFHCHRGVWLMRQRPKGQRWNSISTRNPFNKWHQKLKFAAGA